MLSELISDKMANEILSNGLERFYGRMVKDVTKRYKKNEDENFMTRCDFGNSMSMWSTVEDIIISIEHLKKNHKILDIGSGIGKYCILGAMIYPDIQFVGIELSKRRFNISNEFKKRLNLENVKFVNADFCEVYTDYLDFKSVYTYNPFDMGVYLKKLKTNEIESLLMKKYRETLNEYLSSLQKGSLFYSNNVQQNYPNCFKIKDDSYDNSVLFIKKK